MEKDEYILRYKRLKRDIMYITNNGSSVNRSDILEWGRLEENLKELKKEIRRELWFWWYARFHLIDLI